MLNKYKQRRSFLYKSLLAFLGAAGIQRLAVGQTLQSETSKASLPTVTSDDHNVGRIFSTDLSQRVCNFYGEIIFVSGYSRASANQIIDAACGFFYSIPKSDNLRGDGGIIIESVNCMWKREFKDSIFAEWYGAVGDGVNDDTAALISANNSGHLYELPVFFVSGRKYKVGSVFEVDVSKTSWVCIGQCSIVWKEEVNGAALRLFCSEENYQNRTVNNKVALNGISFIGGTTKHLFESTAIIIGGNEKSTALFKIERVNIQGWDTNVYFDDNSWRINFSNCQFLWGKIKSKENAKNSGECMVFNDCMLADAFSTTELYQGDWHFIGCSLDNHEIKVFGEASVYFDHGHIENPGRHSSEFTAVGVYSKDAFASVTNTLVFISKTPKVIDTPLFYVDDENRYLGLYINNLRCDQNANFNPSFGTENTLVLVGGKGRAVIENIQINASNKNYFALSKTANIVISDPYFDKGLQSWKCSGKVVVQKLVTKFSDQAISMQSGSSIYQDIFVKENAILSGGMWIKFAESYSSLLLIKIEFFDSNNDSSSKNVFSFHAMDFLDWKWVRIGSVVPNSVSKCRLSINMLGRESEPHTNIYIDSVILSSSIS